MLEFIISGILLFEQVFFLTIKNREIVEIMNNLNDLPILLSVFFIGKKK